MNKALTLLAIAVAATFTSQSMAQCIGCSGGVSPSFGQTVQAAPIFQSAPIYNSAPVYNSAPIYNSVPVYNSTSYAPAVSYPQGGCSSCSQPMISQQVYNQPSYAMGGTIVMDSSYGQPVYGTAVSSGCGGCAGCGGCGSVVSQPVAFSGVIDNGMMGGEVIVGSEVVVPSDAATDATPEAAEETPPAPDSCDGGSCDGSSCDGT